MHNSLNKSPGNYAEWKTSKGHTVHVSIYITFLKWKILRNEKQISDCQEFSMGKGVCPRGVDVFIKG